MGYVWSLPDSNLQPDRLDEKRPHVREGKEMNKLLTLYSLIFIDNLYFYKSKVEMNRKADVCFQLFCVAYTNNSLFEA